MTMARGICDLIAAGSQIVIFVTGRGSVIGSPIAPLIKLTGNVRTFDALRDDMDFNAGRVLLGECSRVSPNCKLILNRSIACCDQIY